MLRFLTLVFAIIQSICGVAGADGAPDKRVQMAQKLLNEQTTVNGPGFQYVVVGRESTIFEYANGLADIKGNKSLELDHTLAAFSMTKTLTAIAILQLVERGELTIDDKLIFLFPHPYDPELTIRQLLAHTAGIPNPIPLRWVHLADNHPSYDEEVALAAVLEKNYKSASTPGTKYKYSNIGYWLLGKAIEHLSGVSYPQFITENIFARLGLTAEDIGFIIAGSGNPAKGYVKKWSFMDIAGRFLIDDEVIGESEGDWIHVRNLYPDGPSFGGAIGTAKAFSVILQDLLSDQPRLLGPTGKKLLFDQQAIASGKKIEMTLGWHIHRLDSLTYFYKEGGGAGFCSEMRVYPKAGVASVLMANRTSFNFKKHLSSLDRLFVDP